MKRDHSHRPSVLTLFFSLSLLYSVAPVLKGEVLFREDFSGTAPGAFPSSLNYTGNLKAGAESPLLKAFQDFHVATDVAFVRALAAEVRAQSDLRGPNRSFTISGNLSSALMEDPRWLEVALAMDYLNKEQHFRKNEPDEESLITFYKASEAIGRQAMMMPAASNNAAWITQEDPKFYAFITAQAYAYGHMIHAPYNLYDGSAMGRFYGRFENYTEVFSFIRDNPSLFDPYSALATTALLVPYGSPTYSWTGDPQLAAAIKDLTARNIPFIIHFTGPGMPELDLESLSRVDHIRIFGQARDFNSTTLKAVRMLGKDATAAPRFQFQGPSQVRVLPRARSAWSREPILFHLLAPATLQTAPGDMTLRVQPSMLGEATVTRALFHAPGRQPVEVPVRTTGQGLMLRIPSFDYWGVLSLETDKATLSPYVQGAATPPIVARSEVPLMRLFHGSKPEDTYPAWLKDALQKGADPIAHYKATRLSWSYRKNTPYIREITGRGLAFIGAINLGAEIPARDITLNWPGFARGLDGQALKFRSDFANVPYLGGMASREYFQNALERNREWMTMGANGVQWDDLDAYVLRVFNRDGGDFSEPAMRAFAADLQARFSTAELRAMGLGNLNPDTLRQAIAGARQQGIPVTVVQTDAGRALLFPFENAEQSTPLRAVGTSALSTSSPIVYADFRVRMKPGSGASNMGLYLFDGERTVFAVSAFIAGNALQVFTEGRNQNVGKNLRGMDTWNLVTMRINFDTQETSFSVNGGDWTRPYPFRNRGAARRDSFSIVLQNRPNNSNVECALIEVRTRPR